MNNSSPNGKTLKILLFEDNPGDARLFMETLKDVSSARYETIHVKSLAEGLARESELFGELCETPDKKEGLQAFLGKRSPTFLDTEP